jgi:hypothetical protein
MGLNSETSIKDHQPVIHTVVPLEKPTYYVWGLKKRGSCVAGPTGKRSFRVEITNNARLNARPAQVKTGCKECGKALYVTKLCWDSWHAQRCL